MNLQRTSFESVKKKTQRNNNQQLTWRVSSADQRIVACDTSSMRHQVAASTTRTTDYSLAESNGVCALHHSRRQKNNISKTIHARVLAYGYTPDRYRNYLITTWSASAVSALAATAALELPTPRLRLRRATATLKSSQPRLRR